MDRSGHCGRHRKRALGCLYGCRGSLVVLTVYATAAVIVSTCTCLLLPVDADAQPLPHAQTQTRAQAQAAAEGHPDAGSGEAVSRALGSAAPDPSIATSALDRRDGDGGGDAYYAPTADRYAFLSPLSRSPPPLPPRDRSGRARAYAYPEYAHGLRSAGARRHAPFSSESSPDSAAPEVRSQSQSDGGVDWRALSLSLSLRTRFRQRSARRRRARAAHWGRLRRSLRLRTLTAAGTGVHVGDPTCLGLVSKTCNRKSARIIVMRVYVLYMHVVVCVSLWVMILWCCRM